MGKSANTLWKESGTTLPFKTWLQREIDKYSNADGNDKNIFDNTQLNANIQSTLSKIQGAEGFKPEISNKTIFGINKNAILVGGLIIVGAIAYKIYKNVKS
jgi:hypothetical protein